jgi:serine/threonine protein kinase/Tfp pilus assembly protein PilF
VSPDTLTGTQILHYRVGERLGAGGMGEVFVAEDVRLGRRVALKFLPTAFQFDESLRARLWQEARAASALKSPNVAATYDIGEHDGSPFLVMELVEGEALSARIARGPLPVTDALDVALQTADALDEAHAQGIVHRDIKSANLMITARGLVKVLDFGLAKFVEPLGQRLSPSTVHTGLPEQTAVGVLLGTVSYMSPEQALGRQVDHRTDLYSLGVVLYEMLTGRLPFEGATATEVTDAILHQTAPAISRLNADVPRALEAIVSRCLEKDAAFRYQRARDLYVELRQVNLDVFSDVDATRQSADGRPAQKAIAVMTFANISGDAADDWIGFGVAETVSGDLKSIQGLAVIGRERMYDLLRHAHAGDQAALDDRRAIEIGRRLGAAWIVSGGYQRVGEQVRITARLVDVGTGALVKTVKIDGGLAELFSLQDRIVYELTEWLNLRLARSEIAEIARDETESMESYEDYSRGMLNLRLATPESLERARSLFEKAVGRDPRYAEAWVGLGEVYDLKASMLGLSEFGTKAIESHQRAIALNPRLAAAHTELGYSLLTPARYDEAIEAFKEAVRLDPDSAQGHVGLARAYWMGKAMIDEAIVELERALALNPEYGYAYLQLGFLCALRGDYAKGEEVCRRAIDLQEQYLSGRAGLVMVGARTRLGYIYYRQGRYDDAIREYERELTFLQTTEHALRERTTIEINQKLGAALLRRGDVEKAHERLQAAIRAFNERRARGAEDPFTKYYVACAYALEGDVENAAKYLADTFKRLRALNTRRAKTDPDFDSVRDHSRFAAILTAGSAADETGGQKRR